MTFVRRHALTLVVALIALVLGARFLSARNDANRAHAKLAEARSALALAELHKRSYRTTQAHITRELRKALLQRDNWKALAEVPDAEPVAHVAARVEAKAHIETPVEAVPDSTKRIAAYRGTYADSTFGLAWMLRLDPLRFAADLRAIPPIELVGFALPDGTLHVTAESRDPRVRIDVESFVYQPPVPEPGPSRLKWALIGVAAGVLGWELVR